ncbi:PAS domain S-box protein [Desulfitobacterium hafniense DP7]|uniref:PAS domain S-box protein n=2 Tax=Desulfitobacterium hafniense TaxID=49338 RepID=G9XGR2_DESHA|nr:PAS domain S-box protein [Desulfitobacterium hafniense DP7]
MMMKNTVNQELLLRIMDHLREAVYIVADDGTTLYVNKAAEELDGIPREAMIGQQVLTIHQRPDFGKIDPVCLNVLKTRISHEKELLERQYPTGTSVKLINSSYYYEQNNMRLVFSITENISNYKSILSMVNGFLQSTQYQSGMQTFHNGTRYCFDDIIGASKEMREAVSIAEKYSQKNAAVMLYGETGTGKEIFAQSIHNASPFRNGPFVAVNCAALPSGLLESILFGTVRGVFTGAVDNPGLFEKAENGTIFLDEVNSLPTALQAKLLRVLQEREVQRLGSSKAKKVNFRVICATNKPPAELIAAGKLREDFYYRLSARVIIIPPLRARLDDLDVLITHFINKKNQELDTKIRDTSASLMEILRRYQWPGNVRELENIIESAINTAQDDEVILDIGHIPSHFMEKIQAEVGHEVLADEQSSREFLYGKNGASEDCRDGRLQDLVASYEKEIIRQAIAAAYGNITQCSKILGLTRQGLTLKLKKNGIDPNEYKSPDSKRGFI